MKEKLFLSVVLLFVMGSVSGIWADACIDHYEQCRQSCNDMNESKGNIGKCIAKCGSEREKCSIQQSSCRTIGLQEAKRRYDAYSALFVDARAFPRYSEGTIMRALDVPIRRFKRMLKWLPSEREAPIVVFCNGPKCGLAPKLADRLVKKGYRNVMVYKGGYPEWKRHNLPVMSAPRPCRCGGEYRPKTPPVSVEGVTLYLDPEDESRIDARWIGPLLVKGIFPNGLHLIDVRPAKQYAKAHLPRAVNLPYDKETMELDLSGLPKRGPILFTCKHGSISSDAWFSLPESIQKRAFILDADVVCKGEKCTVTPH